MYGTETWAVEAENLHSLERAPMMVRWKYAYGNLQHDVNIFAFK